MSHGLSSTFQSTSLDDVQHLVLESAGWELYSKLLRTVGTMRITFSHGTLEITAPISEHEHFKHFIGRLIEMLAFGLDWPIGSFGSTTCRCKTRLVGIDPDESYYLRGESRMRGRNQLDLRKDPPPELVVEIDITHPSIPRLPIYAALGVPEVWRYDGRKLECLILNGSVYSVARHSQTFPFLEPSRLRQFIDQLPDKDETAILREFVRWVRKNG